MRTQLSAGPAIAGFTMVVVGALLLLRALGVLGVGWLAVWPLLFAPAGLAFVALFVSNRAYFWAAVPGFGLLGLAACSSLRSVTPGMGTPWDGSLFLGGIGLGFLAWYAARREDWWAIIPGGSLLTLAVVSWAARAIGGRDTGGVFFLGLALTLVAVYLVPEPRTETGRRRTWALIAAVPFAALAAVVFTGGGSFFSYLWPVLLILAGLWLAFRPASPAAAE